MGCVTAVTNIVTMVMSYHKLLTHYESCLDNILVKTVTVCVEVVTCESCHSLRRFIKSPLSVSILTKLTLAIIA